MRDAEAELLQTSSTLEDDLQKRLLSDKKLIDIDKAAILKLAEDALLLFRDKKDKAVP